MLRKLYLSYLNVNCPELRVEDKDVDAAFIKRGVLGAVSKLLLFCYTMLMMQAVMPLLQDRVAHQFFAAQHIKVVHTENGKQHVHLEIAKVAKETQQGNTEGKTKIEIKDFVCLLPQQFVFETPVFLNQPVFSHYSSGLPFAHAEPEDIPPQTASFI